MGDRQPLLEEDAAVSQFVLFLYDSIAGRDHTDERSQRVLCDQKNTG